MLTVRVSKQCLWACAWQEEALETSVVLQELGDKYASVGQGQDQSSIQVGPGRVGLGGCYA